jgi:hypothetical protein
MRFYRRGSLRLWDHPHISGFGCVLDRIGMILTAPEHGL